MWTKSLWHSQLKNLECIKGIQMRDCCPLEPNTYIIKNECGIGLLSQENKNHWIIKIPTINKTINLFSH